KVSLEEDDLDDNLDDDNIVKEEEVPDEPEKEPAPRGKNTGLTITLCVLNVLAAVGFIFLLVLDYQKRQEWSHAVFMNELYIKGLPLKEEDEGPSGSRVTMPR